MNILQHQLLRLAYPHFWNNGRPHYYMAMVTPFLDNNMRARIKASGRGDVQQTDRHSVARCYIGKVSSPYPVPEGSHLEERIILTLPCSVPHYLAADGPLY